MWLAVVAHWVAGWDCTSVLPEPQFFVHYSFIPCPLLLDADNFARPPPVI